MLKRFKGKSKGIADIDDNLSIRSSMQLEEENVKTMVKELE